VATNISPSEELRIIEEKRGALEQAVRIALSIEQMQKGLSAALVMGEETANFPPEVLSLVDELSDPIKSATTDKLRDALAALQKIVGDNLSRIIEISEMDEQALLGADIGVIERLLEDYRKKSQTAVAIRVLLGTRGEKTEPLQHKVSPDELRQRIERLDEKEKVCREAVKCELEGMISETERILQRDDLPDKMRQIMAASLEDFRDNLAHLESGASIRTLPVAVEIVEMSEGEISTVNTPSILEESPIIETQTLFQAVESETIVMETARQQLDRLKKRNFFSRLWHWATTPLISWREAKYDRTGPSN